MKASENFRLFVLCVLSLIHIKTETFAQNSNGSIDAAGDIAFVAFHDNDDGFAFVLLDDCIASQSILFIDEGWTGSAFASNTSEGEVTWTNDTGATLLAGTVITIQDADDNTAGISASSGTATESESGFTTGVTAEQIYAVTGTRAAPGTFLSAVGNLQLDGITAVTLTGTGLTDGGTAVDLGNGEAYYNGTRVFSGTRSASATAINTSGSWSVGAFSYPGIGTGAFSGSTFIAEDQTTHTFNENVGSIDGFGAHPTSGNDGSNTFTFTSAGSGSGSISNASGEITFATVGIVVGDYTMSVVRVDAADFDLESLTIENSFGFAAASVLITGRNNGVDVTGATHSVAMPANFGTVPIDLSGDSDFNVIDEFIVTFSGTGGTSWGFHDIAIGPAVASDVTAPIFENSTPSAASIAQTGFTMNIDIDEAGIIYYVVVANESTAPTSANVKAGQSSGGGTSVTSGNATVSAGGFTNAFSVTSLLAGTAYDVYVVAEDDEGTPNLQTNPTKIDVITLAPSSLQVAATVFLEGAWNGTAGMNTTLEDADLVSASAPYNGTNSHAGSESVASAGAVPDGAVDWVLVELRESGTAAGAINTTRKGSAAGFLMSDGTIKATDGSSNLTINLTGNTGTDYYVVIYHRNHLPIMSANAIAGSSGTLTIDFTTNSANTYQTTTALVSLAGSKFGMPAGDSSGDGNINVTDLATWQTNNGAVYSYSGSGIADFNLDGEINAVDRNDFQQKNTSKSRQVPSN